MRTPALPKTVPGWRHLRADGAHGSKLLAPAGSLLVVVALLMSPSTAAYAQTQNEAIRGAINNNCARLGAPGGSQASLIALGFGPNLANLCATLPTGALGPGFTSGGALSAGSVTPQATIATTDEERRVLQRLKERRDRELKGSGASADPTTGLVGLGVFLSGEYEAFDKGVTKFEPGYDYDKWGGTAGVDYLLSRALLVGAAFNYSNIQGTFAQSGGTFATDSFGGIVYSSFFPAPNVFIDGVVGYAHKLYSIDRRISFTFNRTRDFPVTDPRSLVTTSGATTSDTGGDERQAGINAGYDFIVKNLTVGPRLGFNYRHIEIDSFRERGKGATTCFTNAASAMVCTASNATGLELAYNRQQQDSLTSVVGMYASLAFSTGFGVLIPQSTVEYVHEFENDQRTIGFRFGEDNAGRTRLGFKTDTPDRDYFNVGVGLVAVLPGGISPFVNYREGFLGYRARSSHTVTAGLRFSF